MVGELEDHIGLVALPIASVGDRQKWAGWGEHGQEVCPCWLVQGRQVCSQAALSG
jgi:hypothetical protein